MTYEKALPNVEIFPGVVESVARFSQHYKLGVVSGSTQSQVGMILENIGVNGFFDLIVTCEDYDNGKPYSQPYQIAAQRLGVKPGECEVLEDAPSGIQSGKSAGMYVIGVKIGNKGRLDLSGANRIVETLDDVTLDLVHGL